MVVAEEEPAPVLGTAASVLCLSFPSILLLLTPLPYSVWVQPVWNVRTDDYPPIAFFSRKVDFFWLVIVWAGLPPLPYPAAHLASLVFRQGAVHFLVSGYCTVMVS